MNPPPGRAVHLFMTTRAVLFVLLAAGGAMAQTPSAIGRDRVLLAFAPTEADPGLQHQRDLLAASAAGAGERDLVLLPLIGDNQEAAALRQRYAVAAPGFQAVLIGKDGGVKLRSDTPVEADRLFALIDTMPMRRQERRDATITILSEPRRDTRP